MQIATSQAFPASAHVALDWQGLDIPHRIALVFQRFVDRFGDPETPVSVDDLRGEPETCDLSEAEIREHAGQAKRIMADGTAKATYDREARVQLGASLILGLMPAVGTCHTTLRTAAFTNAELGELWDEIVARAADAFHADRAPLRPTGAGMPDWARKQLTRSAE